MSNENPIIVAGGTGNVGAFVVRALLERGATVAVPSRSEQKLRALRAYLAEHVDAASLDRLRAFVGDVGTEAGAAQLLQQITNHLDEPDAVVATLGNWYLAPPLLSVGTADLERVLRDYLFAHFVAARTLIPLLKSRGGTYVFVNGPSATAAWEGSSLVSIATAAQQMLFRALAQELESSTVRVVELITHAFIRDKQTQPGSPLPGEAVGAYVAHLLSAPTPEVHGRTIQLRSLEQLEDAGVALSSH